MKIRLTKIKPSTLARYETANWKQFVNGESNNLSLPVGYYVEGVLMLPVEAGQRLVMQRHNRNGTEVLGTFVTSAIKSLNWKSETVGLIETENSVYLLETL